MRRWDKGTARSVQGGAVILCAAFALQVTEMNGGQSALVMKLSYPNSDPRGDSFVPVDVQRAAGQLRREGEEVPSWSTIVRAEFRAGGLDWDVGQVVQCIRKTTAVSTCTSTSTVAATPHYPLLQFIPTNLPTHPFHRN